VRSYSLKPVHCNSLLMYLSQNIMIWSILILLTIQYTDTKTISYLKYLHTGVYLIENPHRTYDISKLVCVATSGCFCEFVCNICIHTLTCNDSKNPKEFLEIILGLLGFGCFLMSMSSDI